MSPEPGLQDIQRYFDRNQGRPAHLYGAQADVPTRLVTTYASTRYIVSSGGCITFQPWKIEARHRGNVREISWCQG